MTTTSSSDEMTSMFSTYSNEDGFMTKQSLLKVPMIVELLSEGDMSELELDEFWGLALKSSEGKTINFDSFVQIYKNIDDLFEEDSDEVVTAPEASDENDTGSETTISQKESNTYANDDEDDLTAVFQQLCRNDEKTITKEILVKEWIELVTLLDNNLVGEDEVKDMWNQTSENGKMNVDGFLRLNVLLDELFEFVDEDDEDDGISVSNEMKSMIEGDDLSPEVLFNSLLNSNNLVGKNDLKYWQELQDMLREGDLSEKELENVFKANAAAVTNKEGAVDELFLNEEGFVKMYQAIEDLFEDDESDDSENNSKTNLSSDKKEDTEKKMVVGSDMPPGVLFYSLANSNNLVGKKDLAYWQELRDMVNEGDLKKEELEEFFKANAVKEGGRLFLNEDSFVKMYDAIENLFEEGDEEEEDQDEKLIESSDGSSAKIALVEYLDELEIRRRKLPDDKNLPLPCGMNAEEDDDKLVGNIVSALEQEAGNIIQQSKGVITPETLVGDWQLLYSTSNAMRFNQGLSGIGGSFPNGRFGGLTQTLKLTKFMQDVEYYEQIDVNPSSASFQVLVNGSWEIRTSTSLFTNQPCTTMFVEPDRVRYGPTSTNGDHWKSLGPLNMLDVTYLDENLRIMRGNTATDAIFVYQRIDGDQ